MILLSLAENPKYRAVKGVPQCWSEDLLSCSGPTCISLLSEPLEFSRLLTKLNPLGIIYKRKSSCTLNVTCAILGNKMAANKENVHMEMESVILDQLQ